MSAAMRAGFGFAIHARDGAARSGTLTTPHGDVPTPAFMPVATYGAVRGIEAATLRAIGARILLANTYHLHERPGEDVVASVGGLHGFSGWHGPWLTDSGGFQVTSLSDRAVVTEHGVAFASTRDGSRRELTPERAVAIQEALGADIAMALDECRPLEWLGTDLGDPEARRRTESTLERTLRWAERCQGARKRPSQALFGIVQGGVFSDLRRRSAEATAALDFDGYAHGGLGLGEEASRREELVAVANEVLPDARPRYLMGLGRPQDLVAAIAAGIDLFDCVLPTRNGRHGLAYTRFGPVNLKNARHAADPRPLDEESDNAATRGYSRAYLHHLVKANETLGAMLLSEINLAYFQSLMRGIRDAIARGRFAQFRIDTRQEWARGDIAALT